MWSPGRILYFGLTVSAWLIWVTCLGALHQAHTANAADLHSGTNASIEASHSLNFQTRSLVAQSSNRLKACIVTADFWGILKVDSGRGVRANLKGGGGTATASHFLANLLTEEGDVDVTFLGVSKDIDTCSQAQKVFPSITFLHADGHLKDACLLEVLLKISLASCIEGQIRGKDEGLIRRQWW